MTNAEPNLILFWEQDAKFLCRLPEHSAVYWMELTGDAFVSNGNSLDQLGFMHTEC